MQKSYLRFHIHGNIATYRLFILINVRKTHLKPVITLYFVYINRIFEQKNYSIFHIHGNIAIYRVFILMTVRKNHLKPFISFYLIYFNRFLNKKNLKNIYESRLLIFVTRLDTRTGISHF